MTATGEPQDLKAVISGFVSGDREIFGVIERRIRRYVGAQQLNQQADRDEITSEILGALYQNLKGGKFEGDSLRALEVYIYSMVKNTVAKHYRAVGRTRYYDHIPDHLATPDIPYDSGVTKHDLSEKILAGLDERCRELLHLKFRQFWSDQELADKYGKTKNAMSTAISRCVKKAQQLSIVKDIL